MKKLLFVAYLYPPAGGKALPGVQRTVKFVRHLPKFDKFVLTLKHELYPEFFTTDNNVDLPINNELIIRTGTIDIFGFLIKLREIIESLRNKKGANELTSYEVYQFKADQNDYNKQNLFAHIKDIISGILTFPDYAYSWIIPSLWHGKKLINEKQIDVIFATGMPWSSLVTGWGLALLTKAKLIIDFRDPWVNNPFASKKFWFRRKIEEYLELKIVSTADVISLNTEELKKDFVLRYSFLPQNKFISLPNGYDAADFKNIGLEEEQQQQVITLCHAGYLYGLRDPKPIIDAIKIIKKNDLELAKKIRFLQMGYTDLDYNIDIILEKNQLEENYQNLGPLPYAECLKNIASSDILVIIQQDTKTQIPSKIYEYIYLNKPILTIAQRDGALGRMISEYQFGDIFEPAETNQLAEYLLQKVREKATHDKIPFEYKNRKKFDIKNISKNLEKIIDNIS